MSFIFVVKKNDLILKSIKLNNSIFLLFYWHFFTFCTDASTVNIYRLVPVHRQIKCLLINRNMIFKLTVASCCLKTPWWYFWFIFVASLLFNMPLFYSFNFYGHFFFDKLCESFISKTNNNTHFKGMQKQTKMHNGNI